MLAKNFKFLYRHYKDKQEVLAQMFHVPQSNISAYVNGKKPIPTDVLNGISVRYGVPIEDLMHKDLSQEYDLPQSLELKEIATFAENLIPILTSNIAKTNDSFLWANEKVKFCFYQLDKLDEIYDNIWTLEHAITLYQKAWDESGSFVALSNCLSTVLFMYTSYNQRGIAIGRELINKGKLTAFDMQNIFLRDPNKDLQENPYRKQQIRIFEKYEDLVYKNIKLLKGNTSFSELGDYYLALCYLVGFADDYIEFESCQSTGFLMMLQLCNLDNKYAEKVIDTFPGLS